MATPFIAIADAARIARTAAQNLGARDSGAMSTVKLAAGHFDARLAADPLGSLSAQEVDTAFAQIRRRAEATGNVDEILAVEALRDEMVRAAPAKNGYQRMFAEFERLASTIKTQKDYIDVLKSLDLTDDSVETRRAQVYLRAFARDAQGLPLADEADDGDETAVADPLDSPAPEGPGSLTDAPEGEDPDSGMPPHDEAAETHAEGVSPHTGQPIIVELGALEAYDTSPRTAQALSAPELSLLKALRNGKAQPVPSEHNATAQHLQQLGLVAIQEDFYSAPSAQITMEGREALKGNRKTAQLDDGDFGMDGPGLADPPPDLTSDAPMEPGTDDAMDVIITVEDPTAPGKFLDLKVMPHVDESDLGSMSDDEFAEANALGDSDLANDGEAYEDYDVYAAEEAPEPESGAGEAQAKDDRPQKLASFKARTRIAAITRVASTILSGFKGKVHSLPEGALISVDGHTHAVLVARRAALAKSAQYGYLSLPPSTPGAKSMVDKSYVSHGQPDVGPSKVGGDGESAGFGPQENHKCASCGTDYMSGEKEASIHGDKCPDCRASTEAPEDEDTWNRRADLLESSGHMLSAEVIERELLTGAEVRVASTKVAVSITPDDCVQVRSTAKVEKLPLRDMDSALQLFRRAAASTQAARAIEAAVEAKHPVRTLEVKVPGRARPERNVNGRKILAALRRIARPLRVVNDKDGAVLRVELAGVSPAREAHVARVLSSKYRTAHKWVASMQAAGSPAAEAAIQKVAPGVKSTQKALPKGTVAELAEKVEDNADPLDPSKGAPKTAQKYPMGRKNNHLWAYYNISVYDTAEDGFEFEAGRIGGLIIDEVTGKAAVTQTDFRPIYKGTLGEKQTVNVRDVKGKFVIDKQRTAQFMTPNHAIDSLDHDPSGVQDYRPDANDDIVIVQDEDGAYYVEGQDGPPAGPFATLRDAEDNARLLMRTSLPNAAVMYRGPGEVATPHMLSANRKHAQATPEQTVDELANLSGVGDGGVEDPQTDAALAALNDGSKIDVGGGSAGMSGVGAVNFAAPLTPAGKQAIENALRAFRMQRMGPVEAQVEFLKKYGDMFDMAGEPGSERRMMAEAALMGLVAEIWKEPLITADEMFSQPAGQPALFADQPSAQAPEDMGGGSASESAPTAGRAAQQSRKAQLSSELVREILGNAQDAGDLAVADAAQRWLAGRPNGSDDGFLEEAADQYAEPRHDSLATNVGWGGD